LNYYNEGVIMSTATLETEECKVVPLPAGSKNYKLDARVRCDHSATVGNEYHAFGKSAISCGSQSYVQATLKTGSSLYFCKHHAEAVEPTLKPLCKEWYTEESRLIEDRKTGSEN
jgi:hypothetical protein